VITSGFLTTVFVVLSFSFSWAPAPDMVGSALPDLDERASFPTLPSGKVMSPVELSSTLKPLVLMASPAAKRWFQQRSGMSGLLRSEEHTSELQSLTNLVCRLLLEKKEDHDCRRRHADAR